MKQSELAKQLKISRQALNVHLRKLRDEGYVRPGRGFIDVTEKGLGVLGVSPNPAFVFIKVSPLKGSIQGSIQGNFTISRSTHFQSGWRHGRYSHSGAGKACRVISLKPWDPIPFNIKVVITTKEERHLVAHPNVLRARAEGIQETKSYVAIQAIK